MIDTAKKTAPAAGDGAGLRQRQGRRVRAAGFGAAAAATRARGRRLPPDPIRFEPLLRETRRRREEA